MTSFWKIVASVSFSQFMANLEQSRSQILEAYCVKLLFSLIATFYITKTKNRTKKFLNSHTIALSKSTIFAKNADFLEETADISKIKRVLVLNSKRYIILALHIWVYLRTKFKVSRIILTSFTQEGHFTQLSSPPQSKPIKCPILFPTSKYPIKSPLKCR